MSRNLIITVVVVLVLILGGWYLLKSNKSTTNNATLAPQPTAASSSQSAMPSEASNGAMMEKNLVKITADGFSPAQITIKNGESVTWENDDTQNHTVNSDNHPTHLLYPFLNLGLIKPGEKKSVTPPKTGTFTYHDHLNPSHKGSITVQ